MASHYFSTNKGVEGFTKDDITRGTSSASTDDFEFRILDTHTPSRLDALKALKAFERLFESSAGDPMGTTFPDA